MTDQGRQFISQKFENFCKNYGILHTVSCPHNPTGNSRSERINQQIVSVMRINKGKELEDVLTEIHYRLILTSNLTTSLSPFEIINEGSVFDLTNKDIRSLIHDSYIKTKNRTIYDLKRINKKRKKINYEKGQKIYKKNFAADNLEDKWLGRF